MNSSITSKRAIVITSLTYNAILYKAGVNALNDSDPEFGRNIKTTHKKSDLILGRIEGVKTHEDKKHVVVDVIHVNTHGEVLEKDGKAIAESFKVPLNGDYSPEEGRWSTDKEQVQAQVEKINDQFISGLEPLLEMLQEHIDLVKAVKGFNKGAKDFSSEEPFSSRKEAEEQGI